MIKAVIVEQYGYFWKLTPDEWREILKAGVNGGYELPRHRQLKRKPSYVGRMERDYFSARNDIPLKTPLDWTPDDFAEALADMNEGC